MRNYLFLIVAFVLFPLHAQFTVKGNIKDYPNGVVLVKIYRDGVPSFLQRVETDGNGDFRCVISHPYKGIILLELPSNTYQLLSDNSDIEFAGDYNEKFAKLKFKKGINKKYEVYQEVKDKKEMAKNALEPLKLVYKPKDVFFKQLNDEILRIEKLQYPSDINSFLKYYVETKDYLKSVTVDNTKSSSTWLNEIIEKLSNDGADLENFGFLSDFVVSYISMSTVGAKSREDAGDKIEKELYKLLDHIGEDTPRGQSILAVSIPILKRYGFTKISNDLSLKAEKLTCSLNKALADAIKEPLKVGDIAPNFKFTSTKKGKKSLYDVKAKRKLLVFWGAWCPHCRNEIPFIKNFYEGFKKEGGEIITFALDLEKGDYESLIEGTDFITDSDLLKWDSPIAKLYGVNGTPTFFMLDSNNKIIKVGSRVSEFIKL